MRLLRWLVPTMMLGGAACAFGAMDGTVVNKTTGKPVSGVNILLVKPGQGGMRTIGTTTTDAAGHFAFAHDEPGGGPQLLQVNYGGVNYNKLMTPNLNTSGVEVDVYEATKSPEVAHVAQRMMLFEPTTSRIGVNETIVLQNGSDRTYSNADAGAVRFYLPPAANGQVRISAQGPQGMPLPRPAERTERENVFKVDFAVKPGETEIQITYVLPAGSPFDFQGEVVNNKGMVAGPLRLVAPAGVTLSGKDIQQVGVEPNTQASIYDLAMGSDVKNRADVPFTVSIAGTGSLSGGGGNDAASNGSEDESNQVTEGVPQIYTHMGWLLGIMFGILGVGLALLFRGSPVRG